MRVPQFPLVAVAIFLFAAGVLASSTQDGMTTHGIKHSLRALNSEAKSQSPTTYDDKSDEDPTYHSDKDQLSDTTTDSAADEERWFWLPSGGKKTSTALTTTTSEYGKWDRFLYKFFQKVLPGSIKD